MKLENISLINFRNYENLTLDFHPNLNIFLGQNAQGKTNLLESIYFLALTRSHRTHHDRELIGWEEKEMAVSGSVSKANTSIPLKVTMDKKGRTAYVNRLKENKLADYIGQLNLIMFAPEDLELIKGSPSIRRRFLDMELGQIRPVYLYDSLRYSRVLKERNSYLKFDKDKMDNNFLDVLDQQLMEHGQKIMEHRQEFIQKLEKYAQIIHKQLTHDKEHLTIHYQKKVQKDFAKELLERRDVDVFRHQTTVGPHRDDLQFFINDMNVAEFGSQGQQRTVALSIKLAEIDLIFEETGEYPILLLDDVMSELDNHRQLDLIETSLGKTQTFITTTTLDHLKNLPDNLKIFQVEQGQIKENKYKS